MVSMHDYPWLRMTNLYVCLHTQHTQHTQTQNTQIHTTQTHRHTQHIRKTHTDIDTQHTQLRHTQVLHTYKHAYQTCLYNTIMSASYSPGVYCFAAICHPNHEKRQCSNHIKPALFY